MVDLNDKFSIGLSLSISLDEYKELLTNYKQYIQSIYFSPPFGDKFHSRMEICDEFSNPDNVKKFYKIIELFRSEKIKLDCVFNRPSLTNQIINENIESIKNLYPDQITCLDRHIELINEKFPNVEKIYSYNNDFTMDKLPHISRAFDTIVVGKYFLRNPELLKKINNSQFDLKLLINNGCSYNCGGCQRGYQHCENVFNYNLQKNSPEYMYALLSFYPYELFDLLNKLEKLNVSVKSLKISNRTSGYKYLDKCLYSYINYKTEELYQQNHCSEDYRLYARQANFNPFLSKFNDEKIITLKKELVK